MPLVNPSKILVYTPNPALRQVAASSFTIGISGAIGAGGTANFSGSTVLTKSTAINRLFVNQNPVPVDIFTPYTASEWLPVTPYGATGSVATINIGCSVSGNPSVTSIAATALLAISSPTISLTITISNPYSGTMTLTSTQLVVKDFSFAPTPSFS